MTFCIRYLSADIAEQRGFEVYAFDMMMDAAKETNDPRLARRAAEIAVKARKAGDALDATRLWHQLAPQSVEAERFFLGFLVVENRLGEVRDVFASRLAKASPAERPALFYQFQQILSGTRDKAAAFFSNGRCAEAVSGYACRAYFTVCFGVYQ